MTARTHALVTRLWNWPAAFLVAAHRFFAEPSESLDPDDPQTEQEWEAERLGREAYFANASRDACPFRDDRRVHQWHSGYSKEALADCHW